MYLLDSIIITKFLENIETFLDKYDIEANTNPLRTLFRLEIVDNNFRKDLFNIYKKHYHRNFIILEILATKQGLNIERQVFNLVRNNITIDNIILRTNHIINLYLSYQEGKIIEIPEIKSQEYFLLMRPE